ncbi:MAG: head maturation protease, ClpP-related [Gemmobacter sp.]
MTLPEFRIEGDITANTTSALALFLAENTGKVRVVINSYGGVASEGAAIYAALQARGSDVTVLIVGMAASAASLAAMGGWHIVMHEAAALMIHEPYAGIEGTADTMRAAADAMDKITGIYAAAYARSTGHPVERIAAWMKAETWLSAEEALELNFIDEIDTGAAEPLARFDPTRFRATPPELLRAARANGWVPAAPDAGKMEKTNAA